jgi:hypothetical protein
LRIQVPPTSFSFPPLGDANATATARAAMGAVITTEAEATRGAEVNAATGRADAATSPPLHLLWQVLAAYWRRRAHTTHAQHIHMYIYMDMHRHIHIHMHMHRTCIKHAKCTQHNSAR